MKNFKIKSAIVILLSVLGLTFSNAKNPTYKLTTENVNQVSPNVIEFDIYLQHTNSDQSKFDYILGQYFFEFNPEIANGGTLTCSIVRSDLPQAFQLKNPTVSGNILRLSANSVTARENLPVISYNSPGTLIAKMRLETTAKAFSEKSLDLKVRTGPDNPFTKVFAYIDNQITDVTNREEVIADNLTGITGNTEIPKEFVLDQNYPNPFNPTTKINYELPIMNYVTLKIYDIVGKEVVALVNERQDAGSYEVVFNGANLSSGIYFYKLTSGTFSEVKRMTLIK